MSTGYVQRAPVFYTNLREQTGETRFSTNTYRKPVLFLHTSLRISGNLWEFTGECNPRILYSSSLLSRVSMHLWMHRTAGRTGPPCLEMGRKQRKHNDINKQDNYVQIIHTTTHKHTTTQRTHKHMFGEGGDKRGGGEPGTRVMLRRLNS